jgi:serralysin
LIAFTGINSIDSMLWGTKWGGIEGTGATLTYSFPGANSYWSTDPALGYGASTGTGEPWSASFAPLSQVSGRIAFVDALATWSSIADVSFTQVTDTSTSVGDIRVAYTSTPNAGAWAYGPYNAPISGDVWLSDQYPMSSVQHGDYAYHTLVHELGHALGLKHSFATGPLSLDVLPQNLDSLWNTVMSYTDWYGNVAGTPTAINGILSYYPTTPMSLDIEAMQYLYGPNMTSHAGNDTYVYSQGSNYLETIWDAGGIDTIQYNATTSGGYINLTPGGWSKLGQAVRVYDANGNLVTYERNTVNIYKTVVIENATGSNLADTIIGNVVANKLTGGAGNDWLNGGAGNDILNGGVGNDWLGGGTGIDWAYYTTATSGVTVKLGLTTAQNTIGCGIDTLSGIECLMGSRFNDWLWGDAQANRLYGGAGNDTLIGGAGADVLFGGIGNDTYYVDNAGDVVWETSVVVTEIDSVRSSVSHSLGANVENLALLGGAAIDATGNALRNTLTGNAAANILDGGAGNDILIGGLGDDTLIGGGGFDWAYYNAAASRVKVNLALATPQDTLGNGMDTLSGIEGLLGSKYNDTLIGNNAANRLSGGAGRDWLNGGAGNDVLTGGTGRDVLIGGTGRDIFDFNAISESLVGTNRDVIKDFVHGWDKIDLSTIDANATAVGNNAFTFTAGTSFTAAGQLKFANGILYGNTDGNLATAEFEIGLTGVASITASDLVL